MTRPMPPALNGTEQRLDALIGELRGLRTELERAPVGIRQRLDAIADDVATLKAALPQAEPEATEPADGETVELRGIAQQDVVNVIAARPAPKKRGRA